MPHVSHSQSISWQGLVAGAIAGLAASWAMEQVQARVSQAAGDGADRAQRASGHAPTWSARTQDQVSGEARPATVKAADAAVERVADRPLTPDEQDVAGPVMHYVFGAGVGAIYGVLAERRPEVTRLGGVPFGLSVWATADQAGISALGLAPPPWLRPARAQQYALASHVTFGLTAELVRRAVRAALPAD